MIADTGILAAKSVIVRPCNKSTTVQTIGTHRSTALAALCGHGHRTSPAVIPADCIGLAAPEIADFSDQAARCCHDGNTFFTDIAACLGTHKSFGCRNDCTELSAFCGRVFLQYSCLLFICTVKCYVILNRQCTVFFCICFCHFFCFCWFFRISCLFCFCWFFRFCRLFCFGWSDFGFRDFLFLDFLQFA